MIRKQLTTSQTKANEVQQNESKHKANTTHELANPTLSPPLALKHQKGREDTYDIGRSPS